MPGIIAESQGAGTRKPTKNEQRRAKQKLQKQEKKQQGAKESSKVSFALIACKVQQILIADLRMHNQQRHQILCDRMHRPKKSAMAPRMGVLVTLPNRWKSP